MKLDAKIFIAVAAVAGIALAVSSDAKRGPDAPAETPAAATDAQLPEGHPDISGGGAQAAPTVSGVVEEVIPAAGYTYVRLTTDAGQIWVAGPETPMEPGEEVAMSGMQDMGTFESPSMGRTFDPLYFTDRFVRGGASAMATANMFTGTVLEAIPVSRYVYVRVEAEDGTSAWLAAPSMDLDEGAEVAWPGGTMMRNFASSSLDRTFDEILFVTTLQVVSAG